MLEDYKIIQRSVNNICNYEIIPVDKISQDLKYYFQYELLVFPLELELFNVRIKFC